MGGAQHRGSAIGLDLANNGSDTTGNVIQFDWAHLTRFAQANAWGALIAA